MTPTASASLPANPSSNNSQTKHIANPRRLLILTPTSQSLSIIPPLLHTLTGVPVTDPPQHDLTTETSQTVNNTSTPPPAIATATTTTSFAGYTTHSPLRLDTKYYSTEVPLWVDEIPLPTETIEVETGVSTNTVAPAPGQWRTEFLSEEARIVRDAVGALVVCVRAPEYSSNANPVSGAETDVASRADVRSVLELMRHVGAVKGCIDEERDGYGDVVGVFVLVGGRGIVPVPVSRGSASGEGELGLGDDDDDVDVGYGDGDTPLSVGWWEDQLFDLGLFGWEVVQWDPAEQGGEMTRNQFGGKNAPSPVIFFLSFFFLSFSLCLE